MADPGRSEPSVHETTTEARAGSTPGVARNVLVIGTLLVVILFAVIVLVGRSWAPSFCHNRRSCSRQPRAATVARRQRVGFGLSEDREEDQRAAVPGDGAARS